MAVRTSYGLDTNPTLAAIAGPLGITVVDILTPQRPWLILNYASTVHESSRPRGSADESIRGGISTMAFQPGPSTSSSQGREDEHNPSNDSILLATARGSGILIWDCSGRALSPLIGRLNASDAWSRGISANKRNSQSVTSPNTKADIEDTLSARPPLPPTTDSTPAPTERKSSAISLSSTSSQATSNAAASGVASVTAAMNPSLNAGQSSAPGATSNMAYASKSDVVTSLAWKGSSGKSRGTT